jgi:hypothetical protein
MMQKFRFKTRKKKISIENSVYLLAKRPTSDAVDIEL